ncbi:hypothetical protein D3C87_2107410 [compost metagenome]
MFVRGNKSVFRWRSVQVRVPVKNAANPNGSSKMGSASSGVIFSVEEANKGEFPRIDAVR